MTMVVIHSLKGGQYPPFHSQSHTTIDTFTQIHIHTHTHINRFSHICFVPVKDYNYRLNSRLLYMSWH